jgi:hypothetical protein
MFINGKSPDVIKYSMIHFLRLGQLLYSMSYNAGVIGTRWRGWRTVSWCQTLPEKPKSAFKKLDNVQIEH